MPDFDSLPDDSAQAPAPQTQPSPGAPPSFDKLPDDNATYGSLPQQALTAAEGFSQGVIGPVAPALARMLGANPDDMRLRAETNPWSHGLGEAAGFAGSALTGTGEAALVGKAGEAVAGGLGIGAEGVGIASRAGAGIAKMATEFGLIAAGDDGTKAIENVPQTVGSVVTDIGLSALLGGVTGGVFKGAGMAFGSAAEKPGLPQLIEDFKGRMTENMTGATAPERVTQELADHAGNVTEATDEVYGPTGLKNQAIEKTVPEMGPKISDQIQAHSDMLSDAVKQLGDDPNSRLLKKSVETWQDAVTHPDATSKDVFDATQRLKQEMQEYGRFNKDIPPPVADRAFVSQAGKIASDLKTGLEDSAVWGKAADVQKSINKAFSEYLPTLKDFRSKFMTKVSGDYQIDPAKVQTYLNQNGRATSTTVRQQMLGNFLDASEKYQNAIDKIHGDIGSQSPVQRGSLSAVRQTLNELSPGAKAADLFYHKTLSKGLGEVAGAGIGATLGHAVGMGELGGFIGSKVGGSVLPSFIQPLMEKVGNAAGFQQAASFGASVLKGEKLLIDSSKNVFIQGAKTIPENFMPKPEQIEKLDHQLQKVAANPQSLMNGPGDLGHYMPNHAQAMAQQTMSAVNQLNAVRPKGKKPSPLDSELPPSKDQEQAYQRVLTIAQQPLAVLQYVKDGTLTSSDLATLKTLYPAYYQNMAGKLMGAMTDHISKGDLVPYRTRQTLSMFLGQPLDSTLTPQSIQAAQAVFAPAQPPQSQQGAPQPKKGNLSKLGKASQSLQTASQARETRQNQS